jgi:folate-binding protein YgfZ
MNTDWQLFLKGRGALIGDDRVQGYGDAAREDRAIDGGDVIADLSHFGVIAAQGPDASGFLQGQFTNDVHAVTDDRGQITGYCSPKGRLLAVLYVIRRAGTYYLILPVELTVPILHRLRKYVLRAAVELQDLGATRVRIGVAGPGGESALTAFVHAVPRSVYGVSHAGDLSLMRLPGTPARFLVMGSGIEMQRLWDALSTRLTPVSAARWDLLDIRAGIPTVLSRTQEHFVPQMVNLDALDGISFSKGCYTGQEIVARTHYLGKVKQRLYLASAGTQHPIQPGDSLFSPGADTDHSIGTVVAAQPSPGGRQELLAVINTTAAGTGEVRLNAADGHKIELKSLPYKVMAKPSG